MKRIILLILTIGLSTAPMLPTEQFSWFEKILDPKIAVIGLSAICIGSNIVWYKKCQAEKEKNKILQTSAEQAAKENLQLSLLQLKLFRMNVQSNFDKKQTTWHLQIISSPVDTRLQTHINVEQKKQMNFKKSIEQLKELGVQLRFADDGDMPKQRDINQIMNKLGFERYRTTEKHQYWHPKK